MRIVAEADVLPEGVDIVAGPPSDTGARERMVDSVWPPEDQKAFSVAGGTVAPDWARSGSGCVRFPVDLARVRAVHYAPEFGAVIDESGAVFKSTVNGATYVTPTLEQLPAVTLRDGVAGFKPPASAPHRRSASVFVPWGARFNYGHFLIDALSGLAVLADRGWLVRFPALAPPLDPWQRALLDLMLQPGEAVEEIEAPIVLVDDLLFCSCMDHFLHGPNAPLQSVRSRILAGLKSQGAAPVSARRLYLSRRSQAKRVMVNEAALESALVDRGFVVIEPERLPVAEQIALFREADVIVGPTGAALANTLFMKQGAKMFELQPENYTGIWCRALAHLVDARWHGYFCPSPIEEAEMYLEGELRPGLSFSWRLPIEDFLAFLDAHLGD